MVNHEKVRKSSNNEERVESRRIPRVHGAKKGASLKDEKRRGRIVSSTALAAILLSPRPRYYDITAPTFHFYAFVTNIRHIIHHRGCRRRRAETLCK
ncbi:hypothetical protein H2248_007993 [Termitomyces sp. 'cryptogamus']|nr:hypothetical protein H2248_007993 [Termitomyces sp. 'cryptogamus']